MKKHIIQSKAAENFLLNIDQIRCVMHTMISAMSNICSLLGSQKVKIVNERTNRAGRDALVSLSNFDETEILLNRWRIVMLVTFVETYLQDALSEAARRDASIMKDPKPLATYEEVISSDTIEKLAEDIRYRWVSRNFVNSGPTKWIERLRQMGAKNLPVSLAKPMEDIWGIRHLIVHNSGIVTREFIRLHPHFRRKVGDELNINEKTFLKYYEIVIFFVHQIDKYLLQRFPNLTEAT